MLPEEATDEGEVTLIEIPVSDKIAGKQVHELNLPHNVLITTQVHNGKSQTVNGSTRMYLGDMIHLVIPKSEIGKVKDLLLQKFLHNLCYVKTNFLIKYTRKPILSNEVGFFLLEIL